MSCAGTIVFNRDGSKCVIIRQDGNNFGFPKGGKEKNETIEQNALRELWEETSLTEKEIDLIPGLILGEVKQRNKKKKNSTNVEVLPQSGVVIISNVTIDDKRDDKMDCKSSDDKMDNKSSDDKMDCKSSDNKMDCKSSDVKVDDKMDNKSNNKVDCKNSDGKVDSNGLNKNMNNNNKRKNKKRTKAENRLNKINTQLSCVNYLVAKIKSDDLITSFKLVSKNPSEIDEVKWMNIDEAIDVLMKRRRNVLKKAHEIVFGSKINTRTGDNINGDVAGVNDRDNKDSNKSDRVVCGEDIRDDKNTSDKSNENNNINETKLRNNVDELLSIAGSNISSSLPSPPTSITSSPSSSPSPSTIHLFEDENKSRRIDKRLKDKHFKDKRRGKKNRNLENDDDVKGENTNNKRNNRNCGKDKTITEQLNMCFSSALRDELILLGLTPDPEGYVLLDDLREKLDDPVCKSATLAEIKKMVDENDRHLFGWKEVDIEDKNIGAGIGVDTVMEDKNISSDTSNNKDNNNEMKSDKDSCNNSEDIKFNVDNKECDNKDMKNPRTKIYIRANQGHNKEIGKLLDDNRMMKKIGTPLPTCIFATYKKSWRKIKANGIDRMKRIHIHCVSARDSPLLTKRYGIYIYIDMALAMKKGIEFFLASNGAILTRGNDGVLLPKYFKYTDDLLGRVQ